VPAGLEESGKRKRKGPSKLQDFGSWYSKACKLFFQAGDVKRNGLHICLVKLNLREVVIFFYS